MLSHRAWQSSVKIVRREWVAPYTTAASTSTSQTGRKDPQIERAIRIKSQQRRRSLKPGQGQESWRPTSENAATSQGQKFRQEKYQREWSPRVNPRDSKLTERPSDQRSRFERSSRGNTLLDERQGRIRDLRYSITRELTQLMNNRKATTSHKIFAEAEKIFDSISGFTRREIRMYNIMFRIALRAGQRQWALKAFIEMKKNGVAPSALTYRTIFEGFSRSPNILDREKNSKLIKQIKDLFEELEAIWRRVILGYKSNKDFVDDDYEAARSEANLGGSSGSRSSDRSDEEKYSTSTARSYASSQRDMERDILKHPHYFDMACERYLTFLFSIKAYDEATALVARAKELASSTPSPKWARDRPSSKLPYLLSSRYLFELLKVDSDAPSGLDASILAAYETVIKSLLSESLDFLEDAENPKMQHNKLDKILYTAMSTLDKYNIPDRNNVVVKSLQQIYDDDRLASLPPIMMENTLRVALDNIGRANNAPLLLKIFESALAYHDREPIAGEEKFSAHVNVNLKDVMTCWKRAILAALLELKDVSKALELVEKTNPMQYHGNKSSPGTTISRLKTSFISAYVFSHLMRHCIEKLDWTLAMRIWRNVDKLGNKEDYEEEQAWQFFLLSFFTLASRLDSSQSNQDKGRANRYSREALEVLDKYVGLKNDLLWKRTERILKEQPNPLAMSPTLEEGTDLEEVNPEVKLCLDYLGAIRLLCKNALDTGEQGADLVEKSQMEQWKELRSKAIMLRKLYDGQQTFDSEEAEWLRSGDKRKKPLALTDDDLRELLG